MANRTQRAANKKAKFLAKLRLGYSISGAAKSAGIGRQTAYDWRKLDKDFATEWDDSYECGTDVYEDVLRSRALGGDTACLIFALKSRRPDVYRERIQHDNTNRTVPVTKDELLAGLWNLNTKDYDELRKELDAAESPESHA